MGLCGNFAHSSCASWGRGLSLQKIFISNPLEIIRRRSASWGRGLSLQKIFSFNPLEIMSYKCSQVSMSELLVVAFVWRSSPLSFFVITLWGQALKQQQPNLGIHQAKFNQGLKDMTNTLIHCWRGNMNCFENH